MYKSILLFSHIFIIKGFIIKNTNNSTLNSDLMYQSMNVTEMLSKINDILFLDSMLTCKHVENNYTTKQEGILMNCTLQQKTVNSGKHTFTWTVPLIWLCFIPTLIACFSYILKCKIKKLSNTEQSLDRIHRNGNSS